MKLTDLIKALVDVLDQTGDCEVYITTENETKMYNSVLLHFLPESNYLDKPILRMEGTESDE